MQQLQPKTFAENGSEIIYDYDATGDLLEAVLVPTRARGLLVSTLRGTPLS